MKTLFLAMALALFGAVNAKASEGVFDIGFSTFVVVSVDVTTGTAVRVNSPPSGFSATPALYRFINNAASASSWHMWLGGSDVDTAGKGEYLAAGGNKAEWKVSKDYRRNGNLAPIYAIAANSATVTTLPKLTVIWFGY